ncbi:MAG: glycosyltransferase family 4 protein [Deltaproteobacteria bacterium]|nr:glycosyltransferase family 4 protein [Deltaproteobacteria bacterium]
MRIAFVIPRFAEGLVGGAETLALEVIRHLPADRYETEVWTTCALDHHSWADHFPEGASRIGALTVRRFRTNPRNLELFVHLQHRIHHQLGLSLEEELVWLANSVNSDRLLDHVGRHADEMDALVFLPYLFGVTLTGATIAPAKSVLIPCLHDEPYAYLRIVRNLFEGVRCILFNSAPEGELARRLYELDGSRESVVGMGFDLARRTGSADRFRAKHGLRGPYVLYFGRKEDGKNTNWLARQFASRDCRRRQDLKLVFAGSGELDIPSEACDSIVDIAFLTEEEKRDAIAGAVAVVQPSVNESFSIVLMEAWLHEKPVLVHARCAVTRRHAADAGGGLWFESGAELGECISFLLDNPETAGRMGAAGRRYVEREYSWEAVVGRFDRALERVVS